MAKSVKLSLVWLWMTAVTIATVGISVHRIYCYCLNETSFSLFEATDPCDAAHAAPADEPASCCSKDKMSCCSKPDDGASVDGEHGCMDESTEIFQLKGDFWLQKSPDLKLEYPVWFEEAPLFKRFVRPALCQVQPERQYRPPPPLTGRAICQRHQIFRI